jgi:ATP-dependent RNA helicase SUPV3L1/SUV3
MPDITPVEMPDITPSEMPMDTPMEIPGGMTMAAEEPAASAAAAEMEVFYSFTWVGRAAQRRQSEGQRPRGESRGPRRVGQQPRGERPQGDRRGPPRQDRTVAPAVEGAAPTEAGQAPPQQQRRDSRPPRADGERPGFEGKGKPRGDRPEREGRDNRAPRHDRNENRNRGAQSFEAAPPREDKRRIDPDNPFAAALAGFKAK